MKGSDETFPTIIQGTKQFLIPVFQRDYRWTRQHCHQLWRDILAINRGGKNTHFIGSVVSVQEKKSSPGFQRWVLIDGQQRMATLILLLAALRDHIRHTGWTGSDDGPTADKIDSNYVRNAHERGSKQYKLVLRRHDDATLRAIIDGNTQDPPANASRHLLDNYHFFREQLENQDPEVLFFGINSLILVDIVLHRPADDPQLIFESLNSTGLDLSQADLIRNWLLMNLDDDNQEVLYSKYWVPIEKWFRRVPWALDDFLRDYIALRTRARKAETFDRIYVAFRREFSKDRGSIDTLEHLLVHLHRFARYYSAFIPGSSAWPGLHESLARVRRRSLAPALLVMQLLAHHDDGKLSEEEFKEAMRLLESYLFRRAVCERPSNSYWQHFADLAYTIRNDRPLASLKVRLHNKRKSNYSFPTDEEFEGALIDDDIYGKRACWSLLEGLENYDTRELTNCYTLSIEHIMPQNPNLRSEWRKMLGKDWRGVQARWLHRLGNLTLTGYNSMYSDRSFEDKKNMEGGFNQSAVRLNADVRDKSQWTASEMEARGHVLAKRAMRVWPALSVPGRMQREINELDLRERANRRRPEHVEMTDQARSLFLEWKRTMGLGTSDVIEVSERKSISYHDPDFFVEVLPRKYYLLVIVPVDFSEIDDQTGFVRDTREWKFIPNARHAAGVAMEIWNIEQIERSKPVVMMARNLGQK